MWLGVGAGAGLLTSWHLGRQHGRSEVAREVAALVVRVEDASAAILEREATYTRPARLAASAPSLPPPQPPPSAQTCPAVGMGGGSSGSPGDSLHGRGLAEAAQGGEQIAGSAAPRSPMREAMRQTGKAMKRAVGIPSKAEIARRKFEGRSP